MSTPDKSATSSSDAAIRSEQAGWHARPQNEALSHLNASPEGLSAAEAARRLEQYGRNALPAGVGKTALQRFLAQFNNLLIYVLLAAAGVTALLGHAIDTGVILAVVVLNALIGFIQEGKAEAALEAIRAMISPKASVLRDGARATIDAAELVPGDILLLQAGDRVTADVRLIKARNLRIDEAILTGESVAVEKRTEPVAGDAPLGDRRSVGFSGTLVTAGQGAGVVVATAGHTELGRISALLGRVEQLETPLIRKMNEFARLLTWVILALSLATFAFAALVRGYPLPDAFMAVVGMAVAAIPEGLPAVMTITLAIGVQRMAMRNAIIRRLPAVETLGSVSTICSDKTGTLTRNEMTVTRVVLSDRIIEVGGVGYAPRGGFSADVGEVDPQSDARIVELTQTALLCSDATIREVDSEYIVDGDPMEGALVTLGLKAGHDRARLSKTLPRLDEIPFDAAHRYMATLHRSHDGVVRAYVKGAPERILDMCACQASSEGETPIDKTYWPEAVNRLARDGRRVLAFATRSFPSEKRSISFGDVDQGLTLIGLVGLIDPPRPEAIAAIAECRTAGIAVKMITGDHAATASAIARELGLDTPEAVMTGQDLDNLDANGFRAAIRSTSVFARTTPEHKLRLVEAMQAERGVIAMTGDGVNDAPALKRADVGVAMGRSGTEAAKEAADMVLADDNFASIVAATREGRTVYDNLTKVIGWTLPTNGGETLIVVAAILFGLTLPITPVQILWINMVTAVGLGLVLAFEPAEPGVMQRPPRRHDAPILNSALLWRVCLVSLLFAVGAFGMFAWAVARGQSLETARTMVVNAIVVMEIAYLFSVRYIHGSSITVQGVLGTPAVLIGVSGVVALQLAFTYMPAMQALFQTRSIAIVDGVVIIGTGIMLLLILEIEKRVRLALYPPPSQPREPST
jgi:magnesium-transporting ATPase (P-type)